VLGDGSGAGEPGQAFACSRNRSISARQGHAKEPGAQLRSFAETADAAQPSVSLTEKRSSDPVLRFVVVGGW